MHETTALIVQTKETNRLRVLEEAICSSQVSDSVAFRNPAGKFENILARFPLRARSLEQCTQERLCAALDAELVPILLQYALLTEVLVFKRELKACNDASSVKLARRHFICRLTNLREMGAP